VTAVISLPLLRILTHTVVSGYGFAESGSRLRWRTYSGFMTQMVKHYSCLKLLTVFIKVYIPHKNIQLFRELFKIYKFLIFWRQFWRFRVSGILKACSLISFWQLTFGRSPRAWGSCTRAPGCCTATSPPSPFSSTSTGPGKLPASSTVSVRDFCVAIDQSTTIWFMIWIRVYSSLQYRYRFWYLWWLDSSYG